MAKKFQFKGNDIDDAVNKACGRFGGDRDELDISVLSTGSTGIFGLLKKQASIEACLKVEAETAGEEEMPKPQKKPVARKKVAKKAEVKDVVVEPCQSAEPAVEGDEKPAEEKSASKGRSRYRPAPHQPVPVAEEFHPVLEAELIKLLTLMGMSGEISFSEENGKTKLDIQGELLIEPLTASDGQALDGLQYLLRKITGHALPENGMFVVDIDGFRLKRRTELQDLAITLSDEVKEKNVTRTIPPLNPSERRIVHMHLQDDTSIRSRSVGSGLFKKILIYKPGSRKRSNRKRSGRSRGGKGGRQDANGNK